MFSFSEKSQPGSNKDLQNSIIKEEISSEDKEDEYKTAKTKKKYKIINPQKNR